MQGFAIVFGHCAPWSPPSAKAALLGVVWFFGIGTPAPPAWADLEQAMTEQYVAAGETAPQAAAEVGRLEDCWKVWP